jgi:hypothetical protein
MWDTASSAYVDAVPRTVRLRMLSGTLKVGHLTQTGVETHHISRSLRFQLRIRTQPHLSYRSIPAKEIVEIGTGDVVVPMRSIEVVESATLPSTENKSEA